MSMRPAGPLGSTSLPKAAGTALVLLAAFGLGTALWGRARPHREQFALSPQDCNTECQSRQTDCILECDGKVPCETACVRSGAACVGQCKAPAPDAGSPKK